MFCWTPFIFGNSFYSKSDSEHGHWGVRQEFHLCCYEISTSSVTPRSALAFNQLGPILASTSKSQSCPYKTFITAMVGWEECFKPLFRLPRATKMKGLNVFSWGLLGGVRAGRERDRERWRDRDTKWEWEFPRENLRTVRSKSGRKKSLRSSLLFNLSNHWFASHRWVLILLFFWDAVELGDSGTGDTACSLASESFSSRNTLVIEPCLPFLRMLPMVPAQSEVSNPA